MKHWVISIAASAAFLGTGLMAQVQPRPYFTIACVKAKPGKGTEYRQFASDVGRKLAQARADSGQTAGWYLLRSVYPSGSEARCDYMSITIYPGAPPAPAGREGLARLLQRAGVNMTPDEYFQKLTSLSELVSSELWRSDIRVGESQKGDYLYINYMKVHDMQEYMNLEQTVWRPMAEAWTKDGSMRAWRFNRPVLPGGTELKYQAASVDIYPSWDAVFKARPVAEMFKKVHPDKDQTWTMQRIGKARDLARRELLVIEEKVVPAPAKQ